MLVEKNQKFSFEPRRQLFIILVLIFLFELIVMFFIQSLPKLTPIKQALLDAGLLAIMTTPILYYLFLKPLEKTNQLRKHSENERGMIQAENSRKSEFISMAAHELRTPLTTIMGYSELLLSEDYFDCTKKREFATIIHQKSGVMERFIDDLLDLSHIEAGQNLGIFKQNNDISASVSLLLNDYRSRYPQRSFSVKFPESPCYFPYDKVRIDQVFDNILSNAIKFSPPGSPIEIEGTLQNTNFQFRIRDRGIGMSPGELGRVFDKFYRAGVSTASSSGLGLGMAIVKGIIESHGGEIWLESLPGAGTTVHFFLPTV